MPMDDIDLKLTAYVDGELDEADILALEALLARDPALRARAQEFRESTALLRTACAENFYADDMARLLLPRRAAPTWLHPAWLHLAWLRPAHRRVAYAMAACLLAAVFGFSSGARWATPVPISAHQVLIEEIAEYHEFFARETTHLVEIGADRAGILFTWLGERLNRRISAPDLSVLGLQFAGGRMFVISGKPVASLMYTRASGTPVAICITQRATSAPTDAATPPSAMRFNEHGALRLASWEDGQSTYVVVGEVPQHKLQRIASLTVAQAGN